MSLGAKNPMGPGPRREKLPIPMASRSPGPSQHRLLSNCKRRGSFATFPEFKQVIHQDAQAPLPAHAPLLSTPKRGYVASAQESNDNQVTVGIHFSPEEFLNEAVRVCHPTEHNSLFPEEVRANVADLSNNTVHQIALERTEEVKRWMALPKELSAKERDLKPSISPRIAEVLKDKRLCLLERLLEEASHEDTSLVEDIKKGL